MRQHFAPIRQRDRGAALLVFMLFFFLASAFWLLWQHNSTNALLQNDKTTAVSMSQAKEALIGRSASDDNRPGSLPCPDINNDGVAELFSGPNCPAYIGRLPWKTLDLPELIDGSGERLWYALSPRMRDNNAAQPINPQQALELTLDGTQQIAAIVFSPGPALPNQHSRPSNAVTDYLEGGNNNGDYAYVTGPLSPIFNDKALAITQDDIFRTVNQRVLGEIRGPDNNAPGPPSYGLRRYHADNAAFPWADTDHDGIANAGAVSGSLPYNELNLNAIPPPPQPPFSWLNANSWLPLITYQRLAADSATVAIGSIQMNVIPCPSSPCP